MKDKHFLAYQAAKNKYVNNFVSEWLNKGHRDIDKLK